tara:strand:- start:158 stop:982 length:825 start_codon:yes stop_codon:yes gene_type:complete
MFQDLLDKRFNINFLDNSSCHAFEIQDFLDDHQYEQINKNIPDFKKDQAENLNDKFYDNTNQHQLKVYINELNKDNYNHFIIKNPILNELSQIFKNPRMNNFFLKKLYPQILKSRFYDPRNFIKLMLRRNRTVEKKSNSILEKFLYNDIYTTFEIAYMFNGSQSFPHTDGMKKILSLLLYFPDENISNDQISKLGTTFYDSKEFNLTGQGKNKVTSFEDSEKFKKRNKISGTFPFKKKNLYGFIKSHKSWHSVEPFFINENFVRKNININILLV